LEKVLLQRAKKGDVLACYNAVVVICLLLVKLSPDSRDWSKHFEHNTEFAVLMHVAVACILEYQPCGSMLNYLGERDLRTIFPSIQTNKQPQSVRKGGELAGSSLQGNVSSVFPTNRLDIDGDSSSTL
jgi:hypothetical protein